MSTLRIRSLNGSDSFFAALRGLWCDGLLQVSREEQPLREDFIVGCDPRSTVADDMYACALVSIMRSQAVSLQSLAWLGSTQCSSVQCSGVTQCRRWCAPLCRCLVVRLTIPVLVVVPASSCAADPSMSGAERRGVCVCVGVGWAAPPYALYDGGQCACL